MRLELGEGGCVAGCSVLGGACSVLVRALSDYLSKLKTLLLRLSGWLGVRTAVGGGR